MFQTWFDNCAVYFGYMIQAPHCSASLVMFIDAKDANQVSFSVPVVMASSANARLASKARDAVIMTRVLVRSSMAELYSTMRGENKCSAI